VKAIISNAVISGRYQVPASKSAMQRACAAALLRRGETRLINPGVSNDDQAALSIIQSLGARVEIKNNQVIIFSEGVRPVSNHIHCGESGLSVRMFTPIAALSATDLVIDGEGSLLQRPMHHFDEILPALQVQCQSQQGKLPLHIKGPLVPATITMDGSISSQFLTGLLFAFAAADATDVTIKVKELVSKPYIDLTLAVMQSFGLKTPTHHQYESFFFGPSTEKSAATTITYSVEADWSSASFFLVAAALGGPIEFLGLDLSSTQADKKIVEVIEQAGASLEQVGSMLRVKKNKLKGFEFDARECPDLFPPLVALAAFCEGTTTICGVSRLTHKESDRGKTLQEEFSKLGLTLYENGDNLVIQGGGHLRGANVHARNDHRIAMALAIAGSFAEGTTEIEAAQSVAKSYPGFFNDLQLLGSTLSLIT
jgi:3-phosphoshikimate 1-carboxyvinyltransferase